MGSLSSQTTSLLSPSSLPTVTAIIIMAFWLQTPLFEPRSHFWLTKKSFLQISPKKKDPFRRQVSIKIQKPIQKNKIAPKTKNSPVKPVYSGGPSSWLEFSRWILCAVPSAITLCGLLHSSRTLIRYEKF